MTDPIAADVTPTLLDERLGAVASLVCGPRLADIGTDHGLLPRHLLDRGTITSAIAVEKNEGPAAVARAALRGYAAEVRLGDGFDVIGAGEVDCATLCGLGGWLMVSLLCRYPERLPPALVLQANRDTPLLRVWAAESGYHLVAEKMVTGYWNFAVLCLARGEGPDPAYHGIPLALANEFGPHLLRQRHPLLRQDVLEREAYFRNTRAVGVHRLLCQARDYLGI